MTDPQSTAETPLHLFQAYGVELEYMIVDQTTLDVLPIADRILCDAAGQVISEVEVGEIAWSNELALHVIELKTNGPAPRLTSLQKPFHENVRHLNQLLSPMNACLMPSAMHPWMDPMREMQLWPHEYNAVYEAYNRIFDCRGHGWANLQSVHLNLPFADDDEFGQLHAAIRLLLPLMPALAASSPIMERQFSGWADTRLRVYRNNSARVPSITGAVVPEPIFTRDAYRAQVFDKIHADIRPLDPSGVLRGEWMNARGAIARFDRGAIEIRVLDIQETPRADLAICEFLVAVLRALVTQTWSSTADQQAIPTEPLAQLLEEVARIGPTVRINDQKLLRQFGCSAESASVGELLSAVREDLSAGGLALSPVADNAIHHMLNQGTLSQRIAHAVQQQGRSQHEVYAELCDCLATDRLFCV